jgi:cell division septation protein DedD
LAKKPILMLSRRAIVGWGSVIFLVCAWMFVIGVLVGRGTAPVEFDVDKIQNAFKVAKQGFEKQKPGQTEREAGIVKDKTKLDFYEALEENREDIKIKKPRPSRETGKERESVDGGKTPSAAGESLKQKIKVSKTVPVKSKPKPQTAPKSRGEPTFRVYTIQAASVRVAGDADKLVAKLKDQGFPAYRAIGKIPGKGIWYRVRIGEYNSRAEAGRMLEKLKKKGIKPIIVEK